jgi:hypothetical protein
MAFQSIEATSVSEAMKNLQDGPERVIIDLSLWDGSSR